MRRLLARALAQLPRRRRHRWQENPDHESTAVLCRLAWHRWAVTTVLDDDTDARSRVVGRIRECRDCGRIEEEVRL